MDEIPHVSHDVIAAATQLVKTGRLDQARDLLIHFIAQNPNSEQAWLLMSYVISDPVKQKDCLERVLTINPDNQVAKSKLAIVLKKLMESSANEKKEPVPEAASVRIGIPEARAVPSIPAAVPAPAAPKEKPHGIASKDADVSIPIADIRNASMGNGKSLLSKGWIRIAAIGLAVLVLIILAAAMFFGIIGPALSKRSPTPTSTPETIYIMTLPEAWTQTLTSTPTYTFIPTSTSTPTASLIPTHIKTE
jgi:hypothetical protein